MSNQRNDNMVMLTGLWKNTSKSGMTYLGGSLGMARVMVFPIKDPRDGGPTHKLMLVEKDDRAEGGGGGYQQRPSQQRPAPTAAPASSPEFNDDDIPF